VAAGEAIKGNVFLAKVFGYTRLNFETHPAMFRTVPCSLHPLIQLAEVPRAFQLLIWPLLLAARQFLYAATLLSHSPSAFLFLATL